MLALIVDIPMDGYCDNAGNLNDKKHGYRWSASPKDDRNARHFRFNVDDGRLYRTNRSGAFPVRPVFK